MMQETVSVLGSTGSIGSNTLDVIQRNPERFKVQALTAHRNVSQLVEQCVRHDARLAVIADSSLEKELASWERLSSAIALVLNTA